METKKIEALLTSVELGSFMKAADKLGYTQSGLTHMMNALEAQIGLQLLERGRFGIRLTPEGERLLPFFRSYVILDRKVKTEIDYIHEQKQDIIHIGAYTCIARQWLPVMLRDFREQYPEVEFELKVGSMDDIFTWLQDEVIDICFASSYHKYNYEFLPLKKDYFKAVLPPDYPANGLEAFPIENMNNASFFMPSYGLAHDVQVILDAHGVKPAIKPTYADNNVILSLVARGLGFSMLSELELSDMTENVITLAISPASYRHLGIFAKSFAKTSYMTRKFVSFAQKVTL